MKKKKQEEKNKPRGKKEVKKRLHIRNKHRFRYDFDKLISSYNGLSKYLSSNKYGDVSIDFANPEAVLALNKALLFHFYNIKYWDIPPDYLCPPIPGRADYIHYAADLLATNNFGNVPKGNKIRCLDIGVGSNCIYPIIGNSEYGWSFLGTDIDKLAVSSATDIVSSNSSLTDNVEIRLQTNPHDILLSVLEDNEKADIVICNPPFHDSPEEAREASNRKLNNLNLGSKDKAVLNFGGKNNELWTKGGESKFIVDMIIQSKNVSNSCYWFSSLVSKKTTLKKVYAALEKVKAEEVVTIPMGQGNKISRVVAWTFLTKLDQKNWIKKRW